MKIVVMGSSGFIGARLVEELNAHGHEVLAYSSQQCDLRSEVPSFPKDIDAAYYLVHGMAKRYDSLFQIEQVQAEHFTSALKKTTCKQIIFLGGLASGEVKSEHLRSRLNVERCLKESQIPLTVLRASIIVGEGSSSFEMIRYLTERIPLMITPKWVSSKSQPISVEDVLYYLRTVLLKREVMGESFDIGGPDVLSFKEMMRTYARVRGLRRLILGVSCVALKPSYWWVTLFSPANRYLAKSLVHSLSQDFVCRETHIQTLIPHACQSYATSVATAFKTNSVPKFGCRKYFLTRTFDGDPKSVTALLKQQKKCSLLFRKMNGFYFANLPKIGEGWLEFTVEAQSLQLIATFRPLGLFGRLYWLVMTPCHAYIFRRIMRQIIKSSFKKRIMC